MTPQELRFVCIAEPGTPTETISLLAEACAQRDVTFAGIDATTFDLTQGAALGPGDLLYRPGVGPAAYAVEQALFADGVRTFYRDPDGPWTYLGADLSLFARHGLSVPRALPCRSADPAQLRAEVAYLGGLPLVLKYGGEGGIGTVRADTWPTLISLADMAVDRGPALTMVQYIPDAMHWRLVVVGDEVVAAYPNPTRPDDFRSTPSEDASDYLASGPPAAEQLAIAAARVLRLDCVGADLLVTPSGQVYLLEANFPFYFPQAQTVGGIDVAGHMLDWLLRPATRLKTS
ncbi:MAG: hypothetical protein ACI9WU_003126 [Myxococcota bacterium]|jgi:hypothetical protein